MHDLILSLAIMMVAISNLITTITIHKRINMLESFIKQVLKNKEDKNEI